MKALKFCSALAAEYDSAEASTYAVAHAYSGLLWCVIGEYPRIDTLIHLSSLSPAAVSPSSFVAVLQRHSRDTLTSGTDQMVTAVLFCIWEVPTSNLSRRYRLLRPFSWFSSIPHVVADIVPFN
jgi:hypothetical protein